MMFGYLILIRKQCTNRVKDEIKRVKVTEISRYLTIFLEYHSREYYEFFPSTQRVNKNNYGCLHAQGNTLLCIRNVC